MSQAWDLWKEDKGEELMDPALNDSCIKQQLLRCIQVSLLCVEENAVNRPTMSGVISMMTNENMLLPSPKKPAFSFGREENENEAGIHSAYGLSFSSMTAR